MRATMRLSRLGLAIGLVAGLAMQGGCGPVATLAWLIHGPEMVPPAFDGLKGKRVAVVCLDGRSLSGPGGEADALAQAVALRLAQRVPEIKMVRQSEVADWLDSHGDDLTDYRDVGRGVKADMVVGIDLMSFSLHEGQTLLRGRARVGVKVYDMTRGGQLVYESAPREIAWPENGARHVTENEANFRTLFLHTLAERISRDFYAYELAENFGSDAAHLAH